VFWDSGVGRGAGVAEGRGGPMDFGFDLGQARRHVRGGGSLWFPRTGWAVVFYPSLPTCLCREPLCDKGNAP